MTREEEIVRSTMAALASTVTQVRPLRLTEAADEANGSAPALSGANRIRPAARVRPDTSVRPDARSQPRPARRWRAWGAPVAAAALVVALAVALVIVRNVHEMPAARLGMRGPEVVGPTRDRSQRDRRMIEGRRFLS